MTYAELTLENGQRFILRLTDIGERFYKGVEVDKEGDPVVKRVKGKRVDETKHIIERTVIKTVRFMKMNNVYAMLEYE